MEKEAGMSFDNIKKMMEPGNMARMVRSFIIMGSKELVETGLKSSDLVAEGAEYLAVSYFAGTKFGFRLRSTRSSPRSWSSCSSRA